jgi:hypothetical protein
MRKNEDWGKLLGDAGGVAAMLDRLLYQMLVWDDQHPNHSPGNALAALSPQDSLAWLRYTTPAGNGPSELFQRLLTESGHRMAQQEPVPAADGGPETGVLRDGPLHWRQCPLA